MGVESPVMTRYLAVVLLAVAFAGLGDVTPAAGPRAAVPHAGQRPGASSQLSEADRRFAEVTKPGRQSEQIKLVPQLEQFIRDYPDYPRIERVYSTLLLVLVRAKTEPERLQALADEALARFTGDQSVRWTAYYVKFSALTPGSSAFIALGRHILDIETNPLVLNNAAEIDKPDAVPLLEKAIAEQTNHPRTGFLVLTLDNLMWTYAGALIDAGRTEVGLKTSVEVLDEGARLLAELERDARGDSAQKTLDHLRETVADRCAEFVPRCISAGKKDVALRYLELQQRAAEPLLDRRPDLLESAAQTYEQLGKPDLALDGCVRIYTRQLDPSTRDQIARLARKIGKDPEGSYERARALRSRAAVPAYPFALVTSEGQAIKLADIKARAILLDFFFPT